MTDTRKMSNAIVVMQRPVVRMEQVCTAQRARTVCALLALLWPVMTASAQRVRDRVSIPPSFVALSAAANDTGVLATRVQLDAKAIARGDVIADIARQAHLSFIADRAMPAMQQPMTIRPVRVSAREALTRAIAGTSLMVLVGPRSQLVIRDSVKTVEREPTASATAQERFRLSGYVRNAATNEVVRHAILAVDDDVRRESNEEGFYFLTLLAGTHRIRVRALGFAPLDTTITLVGNVVADFSLTTANVTLSAVKVQATKGERPDLDPSLPDMSVVRLDLKTVKRAPVLLGEPDPIRTLTLLPGVSSSSDASTSFNVRGGGADQNLILLDESTIFNPAHILGFLSVFNSDAIDDVTLYKGAIPSKFGGRLSSVVDIRQREGNSNAFKGLASVGLLSSRVMAEGPLPSHAGSFMVAARRSYADLFLKAAPDTSLRDNVAYFYDVNAKANLRLGQNGAVMASGYLGRDAFKQSAAFATGWGNKAATFRWNQVFAGRLFSKVTTAWSDYDYRLEFPFASDDSVTWVAGIQNADLKVDETFNLTDRNKLEFGFESTLQEFRPGTVSPRGNSNITRRAIETRHGLANAIYLGQDVELGSRVAVRYGVRYSQFDRRGTATIAKYANDAPVIYNQRLGRYEPATPIDSTTYKSGTTVSSFGGLEPRFSARYSLSAASSVKVSYSRTRQYLQLASRTNSPTPLDVWEPAGPFIKPQLSDQYAVGYSFSRGAYEFSAEAYIKTSQNVIDFIDGADIILNSRLETQLLQGDGRARGLEFFARRQTGRLTGWVSYTLSRAEQRIVPPSGAGPDAGINGGQYYRSPYDKTHNLSIVGVYTPSEKWSFGSTFVLASGLPVTYPSSRYVVDGLVLAEYGARNSARLPLYHRVDLNATRRLGRGELQFGLLNAYNRFNAQSLRFRQSVSEPLKSEAVQLSVFGIVPSVSYTFKY